MAGTYYTAEEVAAICRVTPATVHEWLKAGVLVGMKPSRKWIISETNLQAFLEKKHG